MILIFPDVDKKIKGMIVALVRACKGKSEEEIRKVPARRPLCRSGGGDGLSRTKVAW